MKPYYRDEAVTIYCGRWQTILACLKTVNHVITDPPYSDHTHNKQWIGAALTNEGKPRVGTAHTELGFEPITEDEARELAAAIKVQCKRWALVFCDLESISMWKAAILEVGLEYVRACIWDKVDSAPQFSGDRPAASVEAIVVAAQAGKKRWNGGGRRSLFRHAVNGDRGPKPHPATKPQGLMAELVRLFTDPGETIVDPYMGSGSTLRAAKDLGRKAIGIEVNEKWCEVAARRMSQGVLDIFSNPGGDHGRNKKHV